MRSRNHGVTLIRLAAALMVLSGHMSYIMGLTPIFVFGQAVQGLGVKIFFLLGGVFITKSWLSDPNPLRYVVKRFFRIWPPLAIYVILATFVFGPFLTRFSVSEYYFSPSILAYLDNLRFYIGYVLPGVFETNPYPNAVNGSLWTLPVEVFMYMVIPFTVFALLKGVKSKITRMIVSALLCVAVCSIQMVFSFFPGARLVIYATDWVSALAVIPFYFIGMFYALFESDIEKRLNLPIAILLMIVFSCFDFQGIVYTAFFYLVFSYLVLSLAFGTHINFHGGWTQNLEISYGIYLWGFFIQQTIEHIIIKLGISLTFTMELLLCTILSAGFAWLSMKFVEEPAQKLCKKVLIRIPNKKESR